MYTEHLRIPVGSGHLHGERVGRGGTVVVLLHGFGTCTFLWRNVAPAIADAGHTALAIDLMGHGESDQPADAPLGARAQADYLDRALTALRIPRVMLVAQDFSCLVALLFAANRPQHVSRLVLLSPPDPADLPPPAVRLVQRNSARAAISANALFGALPIIDTLIRGAVADGSAIPDIVVGRYTAPFIGADGVANLLLLARSTDSDLEDPIDITPVSKPVHLVRGEADDLCTESDLRALEQRLPKCELQIVTIPAASHLIAEDRPHELADRLIELAKLPEREPRGPEVADNEVHLERVT